MARINFRQGIVRYQQDTLGNQTFLDVTVGEVSLIAYPEQTVITFADGDTDYLFTENNNIVNAWQETFTSGTDRWLYWDLNTATGIRTFGYTTILPVAQVTAPSSPAVGQMWFNTSANIMMEYNGSGWVRVLRVFACKLDGALIPHSVSINAPDFAGTQVGNTNTANAGSLVFDQSGTPIRKGTKFFTTEDAFVTGVPTGASLKINNIVMSGVAQSSLGDYQVVEYSDFNKLSPASPYSLGNKTIGLVEYGVVANEVAEFTTEGLIFNEDWDWIVAGAAVNDPVYISMTGSIQNFPAIPAQLPIGTIIGRREILFSPRLFPQVVGGGTGGVTDHNLLFNIGTNTHGQIDAHMADASIHFTDAPQDGTTYGRNNGIWAATGSGGSGLFSEDASSNIVGGAGAGANINIGSENFLAGGNAGSGIVDSEGNVIVGFNAGASVDIQESVLIGKGTGLSLQNGSANVVIIGPNAGPATPQVETNTLYIHNQPSDTPLIKGDFFNQELYVNGYMEVSTGMAVLDDTEIQGDLYIGGTGSTTTFWYNATTDANERIFWDDPSQAFYLTNPGFTGQIIHDGGGQGIEGTFYFGDVLTMGSNKIVGLADPTSPQDAATKAYVDANIGGGGGGSGVASSEYCPGYSFTFVDVDTWQVTGINVVNLFNVGRRLKFVDGANTYYGVITTSTFGTDTVIDMLMEGGDVLTNSITEVCLGQGTAGWSPIAADPFNGFPINDVATGQVGATQYYVAVGNGGKVYYSTDGALTWTAGISGTTSDLIRVEYDASQQAFIMAASSTTFITASYDGGATWNANTRVNTGVNVANFEVYGGSVYTGAFSTSFRKSISTFASDPGGLWESGTSADMVSRNSYRRDAATGRIFSLYSSGSLLYSQFTSSSWTGSDTTLDQGDSFLPGNNINDALTVASVGGVAVGTNGYLFETSSLSGMYTGWNAALTPSFGASNILDVTYSSVHNRWIATGANGKIAHSTDKTNWTQVSNGFNPTAQINGVCWNSTEGLFVAVANNGQICRSTNGLT